MDAVKRVRDLTNLALDERGNKEERFNAAVGALRIIKEYELLGRKRIDVAAEILDRFTSPAFVDGIADRAEKFVSGVERVMGSVKKLSNLSRESGGRQDGRRRQYGRR